VTFGIEALSTEMLQNDRWVAEILSSTLISLNVQEKKVITDAAHSMMEQND